MATTANGSLPGTPPAQGMINRPAATSTPPSPRRFSTMRVTALEPQEHRPDRWSLFLDGAFAFGLDGALVVAEGIAVGLELGPAAVERLRLASAEQDLYSAALRFLEPRPRSRAEVR